MKLGKINTLTVKDISESRCEMLADTGESVYVPKVFVDSGWQLGDTVDLFVYQDDSELRATTEKPYAEVGEFAVMNCVQVIPSGAFLDWGIIKDLFVPYNKQNGKMEEGKRYLVYVYEDEATGMVTGTAKFKKNQSYETLKLLPGEAVDLIIIGKSDLGWNVVINKKYLGLVYASDIYKTIFPLSEEKGFIKTIREDGKIDVVLQPQGFENIDAYKQKILAKLKENYGLLFLSDASTPEEIKEELQMSKKSFKKALGILYREKKVDLAEDRVRLL